MVTDSGEPTGGPVRVPVRDLGDGVLMPMLGLGVWQMADGRETEQAVEWALEAGYRHIDTASMYRNERSVGVALARSGLPREAVFVTTKWLPTMRSARVELRRSLERLGLEYVDLYLIHWPVPLRAGNAWAQLQTLHEQGLARAIGVSNYGADRLERLVADRRSPAVDQVLFNPFQFRRGLLEFCEQHGIVLEAYSPLERGRALAHPKVVEIARRLGRTPAQVLLRWSIQHNAPVIPKSSRQDRIRSNAQIFDFALEPDDMGTLDALDTTGETTRAR
jgi:diketogulonate reductase-like aldo/keto reductase